jgi:glycosyltransferase involved in cell wall biosynthesis
LTYRPLVSVIIPSYNRAHIIGKAIQSVLNQTYSKLELIVVDDCSRDNTENVVKSFQDGRVIFLRHEKNKGACAARNAGINAARSEYIAFQDSDNEWLPEKLEKQMAAFSSASPSIGVVYTSFWLIDNGLRTLFPSPLVKLTEGNIHHALLETNFVDTSTAIVRKECFEKVGMFENLPRLQEWILWLKISKHYHFKHVNEPLVNSYVQPDSISHNVNAVIVARKYILEKYFREISKKPKLLSQHYFEIGTILCLNGQIEEGRNYFFKALRINPINTKLQLSTFTSLLGQNIYNKTAAIYLQAKGQTLKNTPNNA